MNVYRWIVYRGFQDEFKAQADFAFEDEAKAFVEAKGWRLNYSDPGTPSTWIARELCRRVI